MLVHRPHGAPTTLPGASPARWTPYFARAVHGLEPFVVSEVEERGCAVTEVTKRQVVLSAPDDAILQAPPRTADDLFRLVARAPDPGRTRADLARLPGWLLSAGLPCEAGVPAREDRLPCNAGMAAHEARRPAPVISVTASFTGRRTYSRYDVEDAVGPVLARRLGTRYVSRRGGTAPPGEAVDWRVVVGPSGVLVGLRTAGAPLHRRWWRGHSRPGSLHPPVAAAMARLARLRPGLLVVDPCCGAGTLLVEAGELCPGARFHGLDADPGAVTASAANAAHRPGLAWTVGDAARLPFPRAGVDRIVTNPPWGLRLRAATPFADLSREWHRVLRPDGLLVVLLPPQLCAGLDADPRWSVVAARPVSLAGQHPRIVVARPDPRPPA